MARKLPDLTIPDVTIPSGSKRLTEWDAYTTHGLRFWVSQRVRINGQSGTLFACDVTPTVRKWREDFNNVLILSSRSQYAPEQVTERIFIADKRFTA